MIDTKNALLSTRETQSAFQLGDFCHERDVQDFPYKGMECGGCDISVLNIKYLILESLAMLRREGGFWWGEKVWYLKRE